MSSYTWQKSSYSGDSSTCLNVAATPNGTLLRESDNPDTILAPSAEGLRGLIQAVKSGRFAQEGRP
ncbi:DUF397 domain-containing protein [Streptomyces olivoreticuli]